MVSEGYGSDNKRVKHRIQLDPEEMTRAFSALYALHSYLLEKGTYRERRGRKKNKSKTKC